VTYTFHPEARLEYLDAAAYYESRKPGVGSAFTIEVEATIARILERPDRFRTIHKGVHTCRTRTFPYAILYTIEQGALLIVAVMHLRREPGYWRKRIT